jgi:hypothetical protein
MATITVMWCCESFNLTSIYREVKNSEQAFKGRPAKLPIPRLPPVLN